MTVVDPVQTGEVLSLYLWNGPAPSRVRVQAGVQIGPEWLYLTHQEGRHEYLTPAAQSLEGALWAFVQGGTVGLVAYCASQPALWIEKTPAHVAPGSPEISSEG